MTVDEAFRKIVVPQVRTEMANTLSDMLGSNPNFAPSMSAISYVVDRLWVDDAIYRAATGKPDPSEEEEM